jgi:hypothetical protein
MKAILLTLSMLLYYTTVGVAFLSLFKDKLRYLEKMLLSPAMGLGITVILLFIINRIGFAVKDFGVVLVALLITISIAVIVIKKPVIALRDLWPYAAIIIVGIALSAWPMWKYGFDWVGFANNDMATHCLSAQRLLHHGFFDNFNKDSFLRGIDYSQGYYFTQVVNGVRLEEDLILALASAVTGINIPELFMALTVSLYGVLVLTTALLTTTATRNGKAPVIAAFLITLSPLTTLSIQYQLAAQIGGLCFMMAAVSLLLKKQRSRQTNLIISRVVTAGILSASLWIWYPETIPFLCLAILLFILFLLIQRSTFTAKTLLIYGLASVVVILITQKYFFDALKNLIESVHIGTASSDPEKPAFPYFLIPSGIPVFWGLIAIDASYTNNFILFSFIAGIILIIVTFLLTTIYIRRGFAPAFLIMPMIGLGLMLLIKRSDFGLFKLAMYFQPVIASIFSIPIAIGIKNRSKSVFFVCLIVIPLLINSQQSYVKKSLGEQWQGFNELPEASKQKLYQGLNKIQKYGLQKSNLVFISDTSHMVLAKLIACYTRSIVTSFPSCPFFSREQVISSEEMKIDPLKYGAFQKTNILINNTNYSFDCPPPLEGIKQSEPCYIISNQPDSYNRWKRKTDSNYVYLENRISNSCVFTSSSLGVHYYSFNGKITSYRLENDPMNIGQKMGALGRHQLIQVLNPTTETRAVVDITASLLKQNNSQLPNVVINGNQMGFVGRGSARIISTPINYHDVCGNQYFAVDMNSEPIHFQNYRRGIDKLWGTNIRDDIRDISVFGRNISVISGDEYEKMVVPNQVSDFPVDLNNHHLEYSGIYEDGFVPENFFITLDPRGKKYFILDAELVGLCLQGSPGCKVVININDNLVFSQVIREKKICIRIPHKSTKKRSCIKIDFSSSCKLPNGDDRIVSAKILKLGFQ